MLRCANLTLGAREMAIGDISTTSGDRGDDDCGVQLMWERRGGVSVRLLMIMFPFASFVVARASTQTHVPSSSVPGTGLYANRMFLARYIMHTAH